MRVNDRTQEEKVILVTSAATSLKIALVIAKTWKQERSSNLSA
jgi:hypothetical protein